MNQDGDGVYIKEEKRFEDEWYMQCKCWEKQQMTLSTLLSRAMSTKFTVQEVRKVTIMDSEQ